MNRLLFSVLIFLLFGSSFAAAEVDAYEVEEIKVSGNAPQKTAERSVSGLGSGHLSYRLGDSASVLFKAKPDRGLSSRLQGDEPDTVRSKGSRIGRIGLGVGRVGLKLLGGTAGGIGGLVGAFYFLVLTGSLEWCDDNSSEDCGEYTLGEGVAIHVAVIGLYSTGIATGVSVWDRRDQFIYALAGSLIGLAGGIALDGATGRFGLSLLLPVTAATAASEWSRNLPELRRYSLGLRPQPKGGLSVVAALRF